MDQEMMAALAWAAQEGAAPASPGGDPTSLIFMFTAIGVVFYFLFIRPQRKEQRKREEMINQLAKGDQVVTIGGIHGTVESVDADKQIVTLAVAPKISMKFNRSAVSTVVRRKGQPAKDEAGKEPAKS